MSAIGVQGYCFRGFSTNEEVVRLVHECGLDKIELARTHVDFRDRRASEAALEVYRTAGIEVQSFGVNSFTPDAQEAESYFRFAEQAGCKVMSASVSPPAEWEVFARLEELAERYDVGVALHNHGGRHWLGSTQMLDTVFGRTGPRIGLMLDTAWAIDAGEDPVAMARRFGPRLMGLHLKDFVFERTRDPVDVIVGTGLLDLPELVRALAEVGFTGPAILEYEGDVANPVPTLKECVRAIEAVWS